MLYPSRNFSPHQPQNLFPSATNPAYKHVCNKTSTRRHQPLVPSPPSNRRALDQVAMSIRLPPWLVPNKRPRSTMPQQPLEIPGLSAAISTTDLAALRETLANASDRSFPGCRHPEHPGAVQIALSYQHDMASDTNRFPVSYLLGPLLSALQLGLFSGITTVQLWVDGLMPYQDLTGQQWFEVGMNPYADYFVMSMQDDGAQLSNRLWIRLERTLGRLETEHVNLESEHMLYARKVREGRGNRLREAAVEILTRLHDAGETYWIDDKDRLYEWALSILHLQTDTCNLADILRVCAKPGTTYHVNVPGRHDSPNSVLQTAFNLEGRLLDIGSNVKIVASDNKESNEVNVHVLLDEIHLLLHAKHVGRRFGTSFADQEIMDTLMTTVPNSRFIGKVEEALVKQLNSHLQSGSVTIDDVVAQDQILRRLHNMRPIGQIFTSDKRGRLLWKYAENIFVSYSSRKRTASKFGTLNMLTGSTLDELPHEEGGAELLILANDLSVPAEIRALAVHDYGSYDGKVVIELARIWVGGRKKGSKGKLVIEGDQNHPGRISQVDRKTYFTALFLGVMERKDLLFSQRLQGKVRQLADQRFYGKMAFGEGKFLSAKPLSRNVGAFFGDDATNWQIITSIADRVYHSNNFLFSTVTTYRTRLRGMDIHSFDQNARTFAESFFPRGGMVFLQAVLTILDLFLPLRLAHGLAFIVGLYALMRAFATPGRNGATLCVEALAACLTRVFGRFVPLATSIALDYYFYSGRDYNTFAGGLSFRRSNLLHKINNLMKKLNTYRWMLLSAETALDRLLKGRKELREAVVATLKERDVGDEQWVSVLGSKIDGSDEAIRATADELAAVGVFVAETTTGDIVLASDGRCVGRFAFRNRRGELFFRPYRRDADDAGSASLTGRVIVGGVVVLAVEEVLDPPDDDHESDEDSDHPDTQTVQFSFTPEDEFGKVTKRLLESAVKNEVQETMNSDCKVQ